MQKIFFLGLKVFKNLTLKMCEWECFMGQVCLSGGFLPLSTLVRLGSTSARLRAIVSKSLELLPDVVLENKGCARRLDFDTVVRILAAVGGGRTKNVKIGRAHV